ncbi:hypothetical protein CC80DRAFT_503908 [Byssothecium circinans]|uniref:Uncharacterized protein n=1 Tax=Byssothecium circinans TaxID=147558 RepID=A0A6A5TYT3_9PLEO|nr:hypothetical protein CC80DRAFT_503908 [Byssothecium circinans]
MYSSWRTAASALTCIWASFENQDWDLFRETLDSPGITDRILALEDPTFATSWGNIKSIPKKAFDQAHEPNTTRQRITAKIVIAAKHLGTHRLCPYNPETYRQKLLTKVQICPEKWSVYWPEWETPFQERSAHMKHMRMHLAREEWALLEASLLNLFSYYHDEDLALRGRFLAQKVRLGGYRAVPAHTKIALAEFMVEVMRYMVKAVDVTAMERLEWGESIRVLGEAAARDRGELGFMR